MCFGQPDPPPALAPAPPRDPTLDAEAAARAASIKRRKMVNRDSFVVDPALSVPTEPDSLNTPAGY